MNTKEKIVDDLKVLLDDGEINYQHFLELTSELIKFDDENLRFSTDSGTLTHLGRDSIKDHTTAVIELVKNGYDADASVVEIDIVSDGDDSYIRIADSGLGMSKEDVVRKWLRIGYSSKRFEKVSIKDRRKTGEKGIGRLSADRLGEKITLKTKTKETDVFGLEINWEDFNKQGIDLHLVPFKKVSSPKINLPKVDGNESDSGTEIIISELRNTWVDSDLKRLYEELSLLTSPFRVIDDFRVSINSNIESEFKGEIKPKEHLQPEVEINVFYDGESEEIKYILKDKYNISEGIEKSIKWKQLSQKSNDKRNLLNDIKKFNVSSDKPKCGPIIFDLMFYPRESALVKGTGFTLPQLKEYLSYNGGVKIYRDNISVKPYGFSGKDGEDWLNLGERQGQNPAGIGREDWMVKNNQLLGAVYISRDENENLEDSAAREGLVHNEAYYDLRALVLSGVRLLELHRHNIHKKIEPEKNRNTRKSSKQILESYKKELELLRTELSLLKEKSKSDTSLLSATKSVNAVLRQTKSTEKTIDELLDKNRTLGGLATIGIASAVFGHETQYSISQFKLANEEAIEALKITPPDINEALNELDSAKDYSNHVSEWGSFALTRIKRDKRTKKTVSVNELIEKTITDIRPTFESRGISIETIDFEEVIAKTFSMDIETIIINLLTNSYSACLHNSVERKINVFLRNIDIDEREGFEIVISDSGNGIDEELREIIWEALYTTKTDEEGNDIGTGLGLTIIQSIVDDLDGVRNVENDEVLKGAKFSIWLPKK